MAKSSQEFYAAGTKLVLGNCGATFVTKCKTIRMALEYLNAVHFMTMQWEEEGRGDISLRYARQRLSIINVSWKCFSNRKYYVIEN